MPNQTMLINVLPIMEAQASSEIENIVTTTDKLFQYIGMESQADPMTKEALRYRSALFEGVQSLTKRPLCTHTAVLVCSKIKGSAMDIRKLDGTALRNSQTHQIIYTPPHGDEIIRNKLANWEHFIHQSDHLDPLIILAIAHYQFEAIYPFEDSNGRIGRVLTSLILSDKGLLTSPKLISEPIYHSKQGRLLSRIIKCH
ncbi:Fic family protein [Snodgrassella sp. ESL0253]|uniref:Fic family protein n=1 Tax=Snodgrassella sp. ESL0253 TaxID=2705031 RepID=UPI00351ACD99